MANKQMTKDDFVKFVQLWDTKNTKEIAAELGISDSYVSYLASQIRKQGFDLPKKKRMYSGGINTLMIEALSEIGFPRKA